MRREHGLELENMLRTDPARGLSVFIFSNSNIYNNMNNDNIFIHAIYICYDIWVTTVWCLGVGGCCQSWRTRIGQKYPVYTWGPSTVDLVLRGWPHLFPLLHRYSPARSRAECRKRHSHHIANAWAVASRVVHCLCLQCLWHTVLRRTRLTI